MTSENQVKTTLVNCILKEQKQWKICIIENEFGEVAIDNDLVEENFNAKEGIITMLCLLFNTISGDIRTFADCILLNKVTLVSEDELENIVGRIKSINSLQVLLKHTNQLLCLLNSFSLDKVALL